MHLEIAAHDWLKFSESEFYRLQVNILRTCNWLRELTPHFQPPSAVNSRCRFAATRDRVRRSFVCSRWLLQIHLLSFALVKLQR
jgi:hypothetical protein